MTNAIRPTVSASLLINGEARTSAKRKPAKLRGSVIKRWQGTEGGWRRNGLKALHMNRGCLRGSVNRAEYRALVVAMKHRNRCGAKGGRKVDE